MPDRVINLELHWPPSVNEWKAPKGNGKGMYLTEKYRNWRNEAMLMIRLQVGATFLTFSDPVEVHMQLTPPTNAGDIDNRSKPVFDCLEHAGILANDSLIKRLVIDYLPAQRPGFVRLMIRDLRKTDSDRDFAAA